MWNAKQEFIYQSLESFSREYYNMENKIYGFQFESMCVKQTCPNYSFGSDQDEAEIQYDRLSTLEWCNWKIWKDVNQFRMHELSRNSGS